MCINYALLLVCIYVIFTEVLRNNAYVFPNKSQYNFYFFLFSYTSDTWFYLFMFLFLLFTIVDLTFVRENIFSLF